MEVNMERNVKAAELFTNGYNCAQAVAIAFCDITGFGEKEMAMLASPFGGGMGRMREVCGAVSGMYIVLGILYGYDGTAENGEKLRLYSEVQELAARFKSETGSIICREILKNPPSDPAPTPRTEEFYKTRPCARMVYIAAGLLDEFIKANPIKK